MLINAYAIIYIYYFIIVLGFSNVGNVSLLIVVCLDFMS